MAMFRVSHTSSECTIALPRIVGIANVRDLVQSVRRALADGSPRIVLDLMQTDAVDSTALGAMVQLFKAATAASSELRLRGPRDGVRRVLAITRLDHVLPIDAAVDTLQAAPAAP
jgi:anti-sigma B factor antagonist